jgi:hypothetical protein
MELRKRWKKAGEPQWDDHVGIVNIPKNRVVWWLRLKRLLRP